MRNSILCMLAGGSAHLLLGYDQNPETGPQVAHCYLHCISCIHAEYILSHAQSCAKYIIEIGKLVNPNTINFFMIHSTILHHSCIMTHYQYTGDCSTNSNWS